MSKTPQPHDGRRIAFIQARWHAGIVDQARIGLLAALPPGMAVDVYDVPGALEIPLVAQRLARTGRYGAVVGAAFVVDGGIYRHDFVAGSVLDALVRVALETDTPVLSVVLAPHQYQETAEHTAFFRDHLRIKGAEAAQACLALMEPAVAQTVAA